MDNKYPLILVFYFKRDLFEHREIISEIAETIEKSLEIKAVNAVTYMMPTDDNERVECINPVQVAEPEMDKIMKILEDLKKENDVKDE
jgi:hypothetical protein